MKLGIDLRDVKPAVLSRLASDIEARLPQPVAVAIAGGVRASMQSGEPASVSIELTGLSPVALNEIGIWSQDRRDAFAKSPWPAIAELFNSVMLAIRDEEELRRISARRELRGDDDDDDGQDDGWGDKLESEPAPGKPRAE